MHSFTGAAISTLNVARAYDAIAAQYDDQVRGDDWMRRVLHAHYFRLFQAGDRVLDVGCGTGIDALALARRGVHVTGIDASPRAIEQLQFKLQLSGVGDLVEARVLAIEDLCQLERVGFDGLISAFASLSCISDLSRFADDAARLVRPGGRLVLHVLNRFSLWEWLGYVWRRDFESARRVGKARKRQFTIGGLEVEHTLYFAREACRPFAARGFALRAQYGLGAIRPPHTVHRLPSTMVSALEWCDVRMATLPLIKDAGRFLVLDLQRLPA